MTTKSERPAAELLTPGEVARMFRVDPKTVTRWARAGKLQAVRTLGGHRRFRRADVEALVTFDDPVPYTVTDDGGEAR